MAVFVYARILLTEVLVLILYYLKQSCFILFICNNLCSYFLLTMEVF